MQSRYYELYKKYKPFKATIGLLLAFFSTKNNARRQSYLNQLKDYWNAKRNFALHRDIARVLDDQAYKYHSHDYGEGWFYQSYESLNISGFRQTESRIKEMDLLSYVKGRKVLDIGTNSGFLALQIASVCDFIAGFDINPYLIKIAKIVQKYLGIKNVNFFPSTFEGLQNREKYDVVLSFANHSTYDKNTKQSINEYFKKCSFLLQPGGLILFESHLPTYENAEKVQFTIRSLKNYFLVKRETILNRGNYADKGRTFVVAEKIQETIME